MKQAWMVIFGVMLGLLALSQSCLAARALTVTDMAGRRVRVPVDPERIVCIGPGALRLIVYLDAVAKIAGVEDMEKKDPGARPYRLAHPELAALPRCGPGGPAGINKKPDLEAVLSVNPQVIFATCMDAALADEVQRTLRIPLVVLSYGVSSNFDETVFDALYLAGTILHRERRAAEVVAYIEALRSDLRRRTEDIPEHVRPTAYVGGIGNRGAHGIESTERRYIPLDWVGADNVADRVTAGIGSHVAMDKEMLLQLDPDVIFIDGGGAMLIRADYRKKQDYYRALKAISTRRVYTLHPFNWYATNIGTALADAYAIGKRLYEKQFEDVDPRNQADEIYSFLVGRPVNARMQQDYGPIGQEAAFLH